MVQTLQFQTKLHFCQCNNVTTNDWESLWHNGTHTEWHTPAMKNADDWGPVTRFPRLPSPGARYQGAFDQSHWDQGDATVFAAPRSVERDDSYSYRHTNYMDYG